MQGIYVPYWTFDAQTRSAYRGKRGTVYYVNRTVAIDDKQQTWKLPRLRRSPKSGRVARAFDDVLILAATSLPKVFTDALEPWDLAALEPYQPRYLAGFRSEGYTVVLPDGYVAHARIMCGQIWKIGPCFSFPGIFRKPYRRGPHMAGTGGRQGQAGVEDTG